MMPTETEPTPAAGKSGLWTTALSIGFGVVLGTIISAIGTGIHAGELGAARRQATAIESIAQSLEHSCVGPP